MGEKLAHRFHLLRTVGQIAIGAQAERTAHVYEVGALLQDAVAGITRHTTGTVHDGHMLAPADAQPVAFPDGNSAINLVAARLRTTQELVDHACQIMPRPLELEERRRFFLEDAPKVWPRGWNPERGRKPPYVAKGTK